MVANTNFAEYAGADHEFAAPTHRKGQEMSDKDNPFGGMGNQYSANVSYGSPDGCAAPTAPQLRLRRSRT